MELITQKKFNEGELYDAYKHLGCIYDSATKKAIFRVYAPKAISVSVVGDFNYWNNTATPMKRNDAGIFEVSVENIEEYSSYKYYILSSTAKFKVLTRRLKKVVCESIEYIVYTIRNSKFESL